MELHEQMARSLADLKGLAAQQPQRETWSTDEGTRVEIDFMTVETLSCAFRELRVAADPLAAASVDNLKKWADSICGSVTYLLEHLGPLEIDPPAETVLVRSIPPAREPRRVSYYEMHVQAPGVVSLRRYVRDSDASERRQIDMQATHEVLQRVVRDIVASVPAVAGA